MKVRGPRFDVRDATAQGKRFPSDLRRRTSSRFTSNFVLLPLLAQLAPPDNIPPLRPPRPEIPPTFWEQHGWSVAIGAVLLLALAGATVWFLTRPKRPVVLPPGTQARRALDALRAQAEDGALLSRVSQVLRQYLSAVFSLAPGELTTAEFSRAIETQPQVGPELAGAVIEFLRQCDLRKFSSTPPTEAFGAVAQALVIVDQVETRLTQLRQASQASAAIQS